MQPKILLVNPPIYDFSAYDFWLKSYGLLCVAGYLRGQVQLALFDYLDRFHPLVPPDPSQRSDTWERGPFYAENVPKPGQFASIPRTYRRYGPPRSLFHTLLAAEGPFDVALLQTVITYWYPGVKEVIEDIRAYFPPAKIVLGGVYATLCPQHAQSLDADLIIDRAHLEPLWQLLHLTPRLQEFPLWEAYADVRVGVLKLADGCPFTCTYCPVPQVYPPFAARPLDRSLAELARSTPARRERGGRASSGVCGPWEARGGRRGGRHRLPEGRGAAERRGPGGAESMPRARRRAVRHPGARRARGPAAPGRCRPQHEGSGGGGAAPGAAEPARPPGGL